MTSPDRPRNTRRGPPVRNRIVGLRRVRAGDLLENPRNWRRHPAHQRSALRALLAEIGYADALIAREEEDGRLVLLDGHLRRSLDPDQEVPVLITDLTEEEGDKLLATLDPLAALAVPDPERLVELLEGVRAGSAAVKDLLDRVARSARLPVLRGLTDPEDIPALPARPRSRPGDVWELGAHRVACGDATDPTLLQSLARGEEADLLWTDPPYGVDYVGKSPRALRLANDGRAGIGSLLRAAFASADAILRAGAAVYVAHPAGAQSVEFAQAFLEQGWRLRQTLVWVKDAMVLGHADYHYRHEPILYGNKPGPGRWGRGQQGWYGGNAETSVLEIPRPKASRDHPTAKPVGLVRRCLQNSSERGQSVLDPFLGSGATLIACEELGRRCLGVEIDPRYTDVAVSRWERFTGRRANRTTRRRHAS
jgi:DNA modification methylase